MNSQSAGQRINARNLLPLYTRILQFGFHQHIIPTLLNSSVQVLGEVHCSYLHNISIVLKITNKRGYFPKISLKLTNNLWVFACILFFNCSFPLPLTVRQLQRDNNYLGNRIKSLLFSAQTHSLLRWAQATRQLHCRFCLQPVFSESSAQLLSCCFSRIAAWFKRWSGS